MLPLSFSIKCNACHWLNINSGNCFYPAFCSWSNPTYIWIEPLNRRRINIDICTVFILVICHHSNEHALSTHCIYCDKKLSLFINTSLNSVYRWHNWLARSWSAWHHIEWVIVWKRPRYKNRLVLSPIGGFRPLQICSFGCFFLNWIEGDMHLCFNVEPVLWKYC